MIDNNDCKFILVASFVPKMSINWFFKYLNEKFSINKENVFVFEIDKNDIEYLVTFKMKVTKKKLDLNFYFENATIVNIKNGCIFSINGLNRLIEKESGCDIGNVNYKNHDVDWNKYKDKLILCSCGKLNIKNIKKIRI